MENQSGRDQLDVGLFFPSMVYQISKPEYLEKGLEVSNQYLDDYKSTNRLDDLFPMYQSEDFSRDPRIEPLMYYIAATSWNILFEQGYDMDKFNTVILDMWAQEHHKGSGHNEHVHAHGSQITGFYVLEADDQCSKIVIHDPRPAKKQISIPEREIENVTIGSSIINFNPKPGMLYLLNSYVPHEFSRHPSDKPFKFIHFNVGVISRVEQTSCPSLVEVEVI